MAQIGIVTRIYRGDLFAVVLNDTIITWDDSFAAAEEFDAGPAESHLATITTQAQADFIDGFVTGEPGVFFFRSGPWIGLTRDDDPDSWRWITGEAFDFADWHPGEPNNFLGNERHVHLWNNTGQWNDYDQTFPREEVFSFLVETDANAANDLTGSTGADDLRGGRGDDILAGEAGDDRLDGGADDDILRGGEGDDRIKGGSGDDRLQGDAGVDSLLGGSDGDDLSGGDGGDFLRGQAGRDTLRGGDGDDRLFGGTGPDRFIIREGGDFDRILDFEADRDRVYLSASATGIGSLDDLRDAATERDVGVDLALSGGGTLRIAGVMLDDLGADTVFFLA